MAAPPPWGAIQQQHLITVKSPQGAVHRCRACCCSRKGLCWTMVVLASLLLITSWIWIQAIVCYDDPAACECPKRFNSTECESGTSNSRVWIGGNSASGAGGGGGGGGCFPAGEEVELWGGGRASIELLSPGDRLADGGHVIVTMEIAVRWDRAHFIALSAIVRPLFPVNVPPRRANTYARCDVRFLG